ncbi:hypothetical protein H4R19_001072 [Coemansia spiralis]|nr:hypothetical protein H4R19_001072 [Coemansia spiralis]
MESPRARHFPRRLSTKGSAPNLTTAAYFDAFSSIDRSIRSLNNGKRCPGLEIEIGTAGLHCSAPDHGLRSPASATTLPIPQPSPGEYGTAKRFAHLPPSLDFIGHTSSGGAAGSSGDDADDEEAVVAFLCSGLPHYEGSAPIHYDDLDLSLTMYTEQRQWHSGIYRDDPDEEEYVSDSAWDNDGCHQPLATVAAPGQLPSPRTPSMPHAAAPGFTTYDDRIDIGALLAAAQEAANPGPGRRFRVARRSETGYMLLYHLETEPAGGAGCVAQIPKAAVPAQVFESEILSLALVGERTPLPVPAVLGYDFSAANAVGAPFAILDALPGAPLGEHWPRLGPRQKRKVLDQIAEIVVHLSRLQFPQIGSLRIADGRLDVGPLLHARQDEDGYRHLPYAGGRGQGPFADARDYYAAMIRASLDVAPGPSLDRMELEAYMACVDYFALDTRHSGQFVLMPESLDMHHFLVDPHSGRLTGLVDWTFCGTRPLTTLVQPPPFAFDDTPRWEPTRRDARLAHRRNLVRYRQWFKAGLQKKAWAQLGKTAADEMADMVRFGYWRHKFEAEVCEHIRYSNPWTFRAIWEHAHPGDDFAVWFAAAQATNL